MGPALVRVAGSVGRFFAGLTGRETAAGLGGLWLGDLMSPNSKTTNSAMGGLIVAGSRLGLSILYLLGRKIIVRK